jgi:uncharacterized membrane protein (DUF2068 family)
MNRSGKGTLRLIAVFKLFKALTLILLGLGALKLIHKDANDALTEWATKLGLDPGRRYVDVAIGKVASLPPNKLKEVGFGSFVYAALFLTEGIGLWLMKRWAEWFTVVITASLIPLEIYEIAHKASAGKIVVLLINVAVVAYLLWRIRNEQNEQHASR